MKRLKLLSKDEKKALFLRVAASSSAIEGYHNAAKILRKEAKVIEKKSSQKSSAQKAK